MRSAPVPPPALADDCQHLRIAALKEPLGKPRIVGEDRVEWVAPPLGVQGSEAPVISTLDGTISFITKGA